MENKFRKEQEELKQKMEKEAKDRESKEKELNQRMEKSKESGRNEVIELFEKVRKELADRKKENEELRNLLNEENLQRMKEAKDIQDKLDKEQLELKEYIDTENFDNINFGKSPNDLVFLFKAIKADNDNRRKENSDLRKMLDFESEKLHKSVSDGDTMMKSLLDKEKDQLSRKLDEQEKLAKAMEANLSKQLKDDNLELRKLSETLTQVRSLVDKPVVYFAAVREEPYCTGGEEYLTFSHCTVNKCENMDPKSGVFTASVAGSKIY